MATIAKKYEVVFGRRLIAAFAVLAMVVLAAYLVRSLATEHSESVVTRTEEGWRAQMFPGTFSAEDLVLAIAEEPGTGLIAWVHVIDASDGQEVARVQTSAYPMAVLRRSQAELLVSDVYIAQDQSVHPRLLVLDLANDLQLKGSISLPDRINYTVFSNGIAISQDERYLYYLTQTEQCEGLASECDIHTVGVIDLAASQQVVSVALPPNCGFALLVPLGLSNMLIMCPENSALLTVTSAGQVNQIASFAPPLLDRGTGPYVPARPVYAGLVGENAPYMIFEDGTLQISQQGKTVTTPIDLLPQSNYFFSGVRRWRIDGQRVLLGFDDDAGGAIRGVVMFDSRRPAVTQFLSLPTDATYLAPLGQSRVAVIHDSKISTLDMNSGAVIAGPFDMPARSEAVVGSSN